ncbi:AP2/ERF and B3 domain-containing transcription factor At1g51120 [Linum grandiflorum]
MFPEDSRCIISCGELLAFNEVSDSNSSTGRRLDDPSASTSNKRARLDDPSSNKRARLDDPSASTSNKRACLDDPSSNKRARLDDPLASTSNNRAGCRLDDPSTSTSNKRARCTSSASASKFKGVVPQQNGHWGCQIYANHQRIWLGTFKSEKEAGMAYDSAALKLRSGDTRRNFPVTSITSQEPNFQRSYTTEAVLNMIKDGSYQSRFIEFIVAGTQPVGTELSLNIRRPRMDNKWGLSCKLMFEKVLTPSDVSKLNRLVIPKKFAVRYFPRVPETEAVEKEDNVQLTFFDSSLKTPFKFRYCYWKSSQSFVFTRGWNGFVRKNHLEAKDTISFIFCERRHGAISETFYMIDVNNGGKQQQQIQQVGCYPGMAAQVEQLCATDETQMKSVVDNSRKGIMLFGVRIV